MNIEYYKKHRAKFKTGDVFFTHGESLFNKLTKLFTSKDLDEYRDIIKMNEKIYKFLYKNFPTHVGILRWDTGRLMAYEAIDQGFISRPFSDVIEDSNVVAIGRVEHGFKDKILIEHMQELSGRKYDWGGAIGSPFTNTEIILHWIEKNIPFLKRFAKERLRRVYCSEAVGKILGVEGKYPIDIVGSVFKFLYF